MYRSVLSYYGCNLQHTIHSKYKYLATKVLRLFFYCNFPGFIYDVVMRVNKEPTKPVQRVTQLCLNVSDMSWPLSKNSSSQSDSRNGLKITGTLDHCIGILKLHIILRRYAPVIDIKTDIDADNVWPWMAWLLNYRYFYCTSNCWTLSRVLCFLPLMLELIAYRFLQQ